MSDTTGPVSTLQGALSSVPVGTMCDEHGSVHAVARMQGETDSFGAEYHDVCQVCLDVHRAALKAYRETPHYCDWCKQEKLGVVSHRDFTEGRAGPVYEVCTDCRVAELHELQEEAVEDDSDWPDRDLDDYADDFDPSEDYHDDVTEEETESGHDD